MSETIEKQSLLLRIAIGIDNFIERLFSVESDPEFELCIPDNILHRTELICEYIKTEKGYDFEVEGFLMLLYMDFIKNCVKNYNPRKVLKQLTEDYYKDQYITAVNFGSTPEVIPIVKYKKTKLIISMAEEDVKKGQLILDELYDLYRYRISFSKLLENIWIGFIEDYKTGENKRAYHSIVKILKECLA